MAHFDLALENNGYLFDLGVKRAARAMYPTDAHPYTSSTGMHVWAAVLS